MTNVDYAVVAFTLAIIGFLFAVPVMWRLVRAKAIPGHVIAMVALVVLSFALAAIVGSLGRLIDADPTADHWIRIALIALRVFTIGGLLNIWIGLRRANRP